MAKGKFTGGRSFKPGQSGNPSGLRAIGAGVKEDLRACLARRYGENGEVLIDRIDATGRLTGRQQLMVALQANVKLLEYAKGKSIERHELTGKDGLPLATVSMMATPALRARVLELLDKFPT